MTALGRAFARGVARHSARKGISLHHVAAGQHALSTALYPHAAIGRGALSLHTNVPNRSRDSTGLGATPSSLNVQLIVHNASTIQGRLQLSLPLPGLKGLTPISLLDETLKVQDLIAAIKKADPSLKVVEVSNTSGVKLARTVHFRELTGMEFIIRLNHVNVLIENGNFPASQAATHRTTNPYFFVHFLENAKGDARQHGESVAFASIKASMEKDSRPCVRLPRMSVFGGRILTEICGATSTPDAVG